MMDPDAVTVRSEDGLATFDWPQILSAWTTCPPVKILQRTGLKSPLRHRWLVAERRTSGSGWCMHDGDHTTLQDARAYVKPANSPDSQREPSASPRTTEPSLSCRPSGRLPARRAADARRLHDAQTDLRPSTSQVAPRGGLPGDLLRVSVGHQMPLPTRRIVLAANRLPVPRIGTLITYFRSVANSTAGLNMPMTAVIARDVV